MILQTENSQQYSFSSSLIQQMELTLLKTLAWRMDCTTPFSYIELMICSIDSLNKTLPDDLISRVTQLLLDALIGALIFITLVSDNFIVSKIVSGEHMKINKSYVHL